MKKILLFASALAGLFLAGSCQRENLEPMESANTVTYTVTVSDALATKGIGDDVSNVNTLHYEVYRTAAAETVTFTDADRFLYHKTATVTNGIAKIELELVNDQNFTVLFWAQVEKDGFTSPYVVGDLTNVSIKDASVLSLGNVLKANQIDYAAFSGVDFIKATEALADKTVSLTRPVAQLNLATTYESLRAFKTPVKLEGSYVKVSGISKTFDVAKQEASADDFNTVYEYTEQNVPDGALVVANKEYKYAGMNYVGFAADAGTPVTVKYILNTTEGNIENTIENVPVKPNFRTNIIGNLITSKTAYTIELDKTWGTPEEVVNVVNTAAGLQEAINKAGEGVETEIKLEGDIDLSDLAGLLGTLSTKAGSDPVSITIPAGKRVTLNLNGFNLSGIDESTSSFGLITNKGDLSIVNDAEDKVSKILLKATNDREWNAYSSVISAQPGSTLTVGAGVEIEHLGGTAMAYGIDVLTNGKGTTVEVVIDGATVKSTYRPVRQFLNGIEATNNLTVKEGSVIKSMNGNKAIWMQDPSANANTGSLVVEERAELYGNVFLSVTAGSTEWPVSVSVAASALKGESVVETNSNVPVGYRLEQKDGVYTVEFHPVAMIGEKGYATLNAAVAAVQDDETITLVADETFTATNYYDNGGWKDGLGYSGDKSFTIDLGGHTIKQNGALNDYLVWIKNVGSKENTITFKNGTMDAGTSAYCALCTASSHENKLTVNLENITLINEKSDGSTVKIRTDSELNVNAGTKIIGKNSYLGIENWKAVVNIYDGAEIYMNGTSSDNGCLVGVGGNGTVNVYGGYGKGVSGGLIAMTSGGTINAMGGEWIANTDGTYANSNKSVLIAQSDKQYNAGAGNAVVNVTGGTYKGGYNCYGNAVGDAQINIKGGNFNANPANYVVAGYESVEDNGVFTVGKPKALAELETALADGGNVTLTKDVTLLESIKIENNVVLDLNGKTITAPLFSAFEVKTGGELTVKNGKVVAYESTVRAIGGKVTIESGEYTSTGTALDSPSTYRYSLDCREGGELIINGGTFKSNNGLINVGSTVTINGGKFENIVEKATTRHFAYVSALLTINDGEFYGKANSSAGGCFFCGAGTDGDIQIKGGKFTSLWTSGSVNRIFESYFGGTITVSGGMFNTNGGIATFVTENTDEATKAAYPYVAK